MDDAAGAWNDDTYTSLERILRVRAGLIFQALRRPAVETAAARVMDRVGIASPEAFVPLVEQDGAVFDDLVADVTVGETYFFRESAHFTLLRGTVIPEFLARRVGDQKLRAWSAGSSTGEEAYSIAIALHEEHVPGVVIGTDVSRARLAAARRGQYRRWSFRGVPDGVVDRYFRQNEDTFTLAPSVRRQVEFRYLNLASDCYPSMSSGIWGMDVIFCRNVLIYFDRETIAHVAKSLLTSLADEGWLFLGAADPPLNEYVPCEVVQTRIGLAYRHARAARIQTVSKAAPSPPHDDSRPPAALPTPSGPVVAPDHASDINADLEASSGINGAWTNHTADPATEAAAQVRRLANAGRLEEAGRACAAALDRFREHPELHYLHAVLVAEAGQFAESARAAKRALYLDRTMVVAHLALGTALMRGGNPVAARRSLANAAQLLEQMPPDEVVSYSDGEPAARLLAMTRVQSGLARTGIVA